MQVALCWFLHSVIATVTLCDEGCVHIVIVVLVVVIIVIVIAVIVTTYDACLWGRIWLCGF